MLNLSGARGAHTVDGVGLVSTGASFVDDSDTGGADLTADLAAGNGEGVAGDGIGVSAVGNFMSSDADISLVALAVYQDNTGIATLNVCNTVFLSDIFTGVEEFVVEMIDGSNGRGGPAGDGGSAQILGHVGRTSHVQGSDLVARSNQSPCLGDISLGNLAAGAVSKGVVGLGPDNQLVSAGRLLIGSGIGISVLVLDDALQNVVAPAVVGNAHVLGVGADMQGTTGGIQQLTVAVQQLVGVLLLIIGLGTVNDSGPEIAGAVAIIGGFDVLGSVKTETVSTGIDALLQEIQNLVLDLLVGGVQVRQTGHAVLSYIKTIVVIVDILGVIVPAGGIIAQSGIDGFGQVIGRSVTHVVGNNVNDDVQTILMCSLAHLLEVGLGSQSAGAGVVDDKISGLIEHPPVVAGMLLGSLLGNLDGRGLNSTVAQGSDALHVGSDLIERPVPAVQGDLSLGIISAGGGGFGSLGGNGGEADTGYQHQSQHQAKGTKNGFLHGFSSCFFIIQFILANNVTNVQKKIRVGENSDPKILQYMSNNVPQNQCNDQQRDISQQCRAGNTDGADLQIVQQANQTSQQGSGQDGFTQLLTDNVREEEGIQHSQQRIDKCKQAADQQLQSAQQQSA